jgi:UDP-N-acetylglucosamine--N-acetylmuramyl-(pentapeptide) pyrophosphoryl-undecaprenol N-acetylglucosamine transferase
MSGKKTQNRILFAGGGTGGHLFPALAVAEQIKNMKPETEILFVGSKSKIEGKVVPEHGYRFKSIWIKGFSRKFSLENFLFPLKLFVSATQSLIINMRFKPGVAVGSGGYVSGPAIFCASVMGAKIILLEQNSYPGKTTRLLERFADEVHISFEDTKKYLKRKTISRLTGNPVRKNLGTENKFEALEKIGLKPSVKTLLILGGSLGAKSINTVAAESIEKLINSGIQIIWQTGKNYYEQYRDLNSENVKVYEFIEDMNTAYSACDLLLARAGATTISEALVLGIPSILVPSPNVAENHQYYNAKSLAEKDAVVLLEDSELKVKMVETISKIISSEERLLSLKKNANALAKPEASKVIARNAINYMES